MALATALIFCPRRYGNAQRSGIYERPGERDWRGSGNRGLVSLLAFRQNRRDRLIDLVIVMSLLVDVVFIGISTGAVQM